MPIAATCPSCGAALSEASVIALAPLCKQCGAVITSVGGTLGLTSAYGVNDPIITRSRAEADLKVLEQYERHYRDMIEACKQQLQWKPEAYAKMPAAPNLLPLQEVPDLMDGVFHGLIYSPLVAFLVAFCSIIIFGVTATLATVLVATVGQALGYEVRFARSEPSSGNREFLLSVLASFAVGVPLSLWFNTRDHFRVKAANGKRPEENARRTQEYQRAVADAIKAAESIKAAKDHQLRVQIRELDGLIPTVAEKQAEVRRLIAEL